MKHVKAIMVAVTLLFMALVGACSSAEPDADTVIVAKETATISAPTPGPSSSPTATPTHTVTPTVTFTSTPAPSSTPTPTATALPMIVKGDPRGIRLSTPSPQNGAPCGVVDLLDFPLDPPHGHNAYGGDIDFGVPRYGKLHAGEDWGLSNRTNFGVPVYAIGHGQITYAEPYGWRADKGIVIIRHIFSDGSTILSFYGHLSPPSVVLNPGDCVQRGSQIGRIGRPRTPPHLHFEIRSHMPTQPGPGYWPVDPTLAGWKPPSRTIWNDRIASSPGVQWSSPFSGQYVRALGMLDAQMALAVQERDLLGIDVQDGRVLWRLSSAESIGNAAISADRATVYVADQNGWVEAIQLPGPSPENSPLASAPATRQKWKIRLEMIGIPTLIPLANGGLVASVRQWGVSDTVEGKRLSRTMKMFGISAEGEVLWEQHYPASMADWTYADDHWLFVDEQLLFTSSAADVDIWTIDENGPTAWDVQVGGRLLLSGDTLFVYDAEGVYRLNPETHGVELLYALPRAFPALGDIVALPDGGLLVAHPDLRDRRLIALDGEGNLQWQRSYAEGVAGRPRLLSLAGRIHLALSKHTAATNEIAIYAIQSDGEALVHLFTGGSRSSVAEDASAIVLDDDRILISYGGFGIAVLDVEQALDIVDLSAN